MKKILTLIAALGFATSLAYADAAPAAAPATSAPAATSTKEAPKKHKHIHHKKVKKAAETPAPTDKK